ncbi:MAG: hypothetical protein AAF184_15680 [Pseudomonadota bacterium]
MKTFALKAWRWLRYGFDPTGRSRRYVSTTLLTLSVVWAAVTAYCVLAPATYTSRFSLLLPAAGVSTTLQLESLGQAVSSTASPYASSSLSPTEKYKRLIVADQTLAIAAAEVGITLERFPRPRVELVDQTELIHVELTGATAEQARELAAAVERAFSAELERLRAGEAKIRERTMRSLVGEFEEKVERARRAVIELQVSGEVASVAQYDATVATLEQLRSRALEVRAALAKARAMVTRLSEALGIDVGAASRAFVLQADTQFQDLLMRFTRVSGELREISGRFGERHPRRVAFMADYNALVDSLSARGATLTGLGSAVILRLVDLSVSQQRARLFEQLVDGEAKRAGFAAEEAELVRQIEHQRRRVTQLAEDAGELARRARELQVAEAVFASALARQDVNKSDYFASYPMVQLLEAPTLPRKPSGPKRKLAVAGGVLASVMLVASMLLAWLRQPILALLIDRVTGRVAD